MRQRPPVPGFEIPPGGAGPALTALRALWEEVASRPLWAPPRFWRWLALRRRVRLRRLRPEEVTVVGPPAPLAKINDCSECLSNCCVGDRSTVLLGLRDIAVLVDRGREDLIAHDKPAFGAAELAARPGLAAQVASRGWRIFPVLARGRLGACRALDPAGRCSLYPAWPLSCARFPWSLDVEAEELFFSGRCPSFWVRPDREGALASMRAAAVAAYNARIQDAVLLALARPALERTPLWRHLRPPETSAPSAARAGSSRPA